MNKVLLALIALSMGVRASATTYVVPAGSSAVAMQAIVNTAGNAAGNTVMFSAGAYKLSATVTLPCFYGTVYTGPNVGIVTQTKTKTQKPSLYRVLILNDDYTPMEFVVDILQRFFAMDRTKATRVMLEVHTKGKGVCGVFTYEIAETKVAQVIAYARQHQHPLMATLEEA